MSIIRDRSTGYWTSKTKVNGKDKRVKLRKFRDDEPRRPIPDDVVAMAASYETPALPAVVYSLNSDPATGTPLVPWCDRYLSGRT